MHEVNGKTGFGSSLRKAWDEFSAALFSAALKGPEKPRCVVCGEPATDFVREPSYPYHLRYYYHEQCVRKALADPESHGHKAVDAAIVVGDQLAARTKKARELSKTLDG